MPDDPLPRLPVSTSLYPPVSDPAVERELFLLGYRNLKVHVVGHTVLSLLVTAGTWAAAPHSRVLSWLVWMLALALIFVSGIWAFRQQVQQPAISATELRHWKKANLWIVTLPGIGWGSIGYLLTPGAQVNNLIVMTSFAGAVAYSAVSNAHDLRGFVVSVSLASLILMSQIPAVFGGQALVVVGIALLYLSVMTWVARNAHRTLIESIQLRLANEILARVNAETANRAEQANRDKSEFLAAASHDLRQPVHALMLLIEAFRHQEPAVASHPLMINIAAAGQSIGILFNALMELSRLESGMENPVPSSFELVDSIHRMLARIRPEADRKDLALRSYVSPRAAHITLFTDRLLLERILGNLLSNAVRYTARGGVLVSLRPAQGASGCWLEVWDSGLGIAKNNQLRIFDPYVQVANRERDRTKGLGLGLAIVRHASELLGIHLSLRSRLGRGTCFRLHVPAALCQPKLTPTGQKVLRAYAKPARAADWLGGHRVLLVDDDPLIQRAIQALLGSWGIDVRCACTGDASALLVCGNAWSPECVLCDFRLPGAMDGINMLDFLQEHFPDSVGILLTGELVQTVQARAAEAGYMVLFKPVDADVLASTLSAVLDRADIHLECPVGTLPR